MTAETWCELGPELVRLTGRPARTADRQAAAAALQARDDPLALLGDRAVPTGALWRDVLRPLLDGADRVLLIHPSWWTVTGVRAVTAVAAELATDIEACSRAELLYTNGCGPVIVELAADRVAITVAGELTAVVPRDGDPAEVAAAVAAAVPGPAGRIHLDTPVGVPGAAALAALLGARLAADGHRCLPARIDALLPRQSVPAPRPVTGRRRNPLPAAAAGLVAVGLLWWQAGPAPESTPPPVTALVEGSVSIEVPAGSAARRITDGPGSARVEVRPPDATALLHLTQARVGSSDLAAVAAGLHTALGAESPGVFLDFDPAGHRAGRSAVTYREVRPAHTVRWTVLVDGGIRIGIGCQYRVGDEPDADPVCDRAIATARRLG